MGSSSKALGWIEPLLPTHKPFTIDYDLCKMASLIAYEGFNVELHAESAEAGLHLRFVNWS